MDKVYDGYVDQSTTFNPGNLPAFPQSNVKLKELVAVIDEQFVTVPKYLIRKMVKYIEDKEVAMMWEYSTEIVDDDVLFADKKRMPKLYFKLLKIINGASKSVSKKKTGCIN